MHDVFTDWYRLTTLGNESFHGGHFRRALRHYRHARDLSIEHIACWPDADAAVCAVVVSFLNLAEALAQTGRHGESAENLCLVHQNLLLASVDTRQSVDLRQAALRRTQQTLSAIRRFVHLHGMHPLIADVLALTGRVLDALPAQYDSATKPTLH